MMTGSPIQQELDEIKKGIVYIEWFLVAILFLGLIWFFAWLWWIE